MRFTGCTRFVALRSSFDDRRLARPGRAVGRWSFPRPPRPWPVTGLALEGAAPRPPVRSPKGPSVRTSSPSLLSGALPIALADRSAFSAGSSAHPSHVSREMRLSPLHRRAREASTPATTASRRFGLEGATLGVPFRPRGFSPPRRLPPLYESRACCIPLPILGSIAFPLGAPRPEDRDHSRFPAMQVRTPRRTPRRQPERVTAPVAPLPFPARPPLRFPWSRCRFQAVRRGRVGSVGFEALLRRRVWCRPPPLPVGGRPAPSWASFPFKVLLHGQRSRLPPWPLPTPARQVALESIGESKLRSAPATAGAGSGTGACRSTFQRGPRSRAGPWLLGVADDPKTAAHAPASASRRAGAHRRGAS
jgi:hypothetical protein